MVASAAATTTETEETIHYRMLKNKMYYFSAYDWKKNAQILLKSTI
jgi:hypothetical protein